MSGWTVRAIRFGSRDARRPEQFYGYDPHDGPMPMAYYIWLATRGDEAIVVDAGFTAQTARERGDREILIEPAEALAALGVDCERVGDVVLTHLHYDHAGHLRAFPQARFWVQDAELAFWTGRHAGRGSFPHLVTPRDVSDLVLANFAGRVRFVDGDGEVRPGVTVHLVGGHAPGLQVVRVAAEHGTVVLASDATHFYENIESDRPFAVVHSLPAMYDAFDRVRALAGPSGLIVPGHDPLVLERHPVALPGLEGIAVDLAPEG